MVHVHLLREKTAWHVNPLRKRSAWSISLVGACAKGMIHCTWHWKCVPLPARKPQRFCPEISVLAAFKVVNNSPRNWKCERLPAPQAPSVQVLPRNFLPGGLCRITQVRTIADKPVPVLGNEMYATTGPQAPSEQDLQRNLLTGGLSKISHLCTTACGLVFL